MKQRLILMASTGVIILIVSSVLLIQFGTAAHAQDSTPVPSPEPTIAINPVMVSSLERVEARLRDIRQIDADNAPNRRMVSRAALQTVVDEDILSKYNQEDARRDTFFYVSFGFMEPETDLRPAVVSLVNADPAGFYNIQRGIIYLPQSEELAPFAAVLYARLYAKALLDQHFDVLAMLPDDMRRNNPDQALAIQALFEGDAHLTTFEYTRQMIEEEEGFADALMQQIANRTVSAPATAPEVLAAEQQFLHEEGSRFVETLFQETGNWRLVNLAYERPPLSTEHILHPTLYLLYEAPHPIPMPPIAPFLATHPDGGEGWQLLFDRSLGEFYLREHLELALDGETASVAAAGWGGDRFQLYVKDTQTVMAWRLSWDSRTDQEEFEAQYFTFLNTWLGVGSSEFSGGISCWVSGTANVCKARLDDDTLLSFGHTPEIAIGLIEYLLETSTVRIIG
ncbi:MAG: hypothetical protein GYB66_06015 [Chloroflexi bacterium]|nr:hypothetical protein [Chloroflexota bacterium]